MKLAMDSSSLVKRYINENGSDEVDFLLGQASQLGLSVIVVPEIISAFNRRIREELLTSIDYRYARKLLLDDVQDSVLLQLTPGVISRTVNILEHNALRAMDAIHLACAMQWKADLFVTSDRRQYNAASESGMAVEFVG